MTAAAVELQKAVFSALRNDPALHAVIAGRIHDAAPARVVFPYLTFGRTSLYDWSTNTEVGTEHLFTIHVWSRTKGKSETLEIMALVEAVLRDSELALDGHHLVNLAPEFQEARLDEELTLHHGILRYRAVTEPIG